MENGKKNKISPTVHIYTKHVLELSIVIIIIPIHSIKCKIENCLSEEMV